MPTSRARTAQMTSAIVAVLTVVGALVLGLAGRAFAAGPAVTIPNGPFTNGQEITVTGSGFPTHAEAPTGLQIIECSDPHGSEANLPIDATLGCEGITVNPNQINTDQTGSFHVSYRIASLSSANGTSSIDCDATHLCVLWAGTDYNSSFTSGPHAFTKPFAVIGGSGNSPPTTSAPVASGPAGTTVPTSPTRSAPSVAGAGTELAVTGIPTLIVWLVAVGWVLAVLGFAGRRLTARNTR